MELYKKIILFLLLVTISTSNFAQEKTRLEHKIIVGYNLGATAPFPLPREVRKISAVWPQFTPQLGYSFIYNQNEQWSLRTGIMINLIGMGVRDEVKYMYTDVMIEDGGNVKGYFTGKNETTIKLSYITIPITVGYNINDKWQVNAGGYISYCSSSEFTGTVWDGYLRQTDSNDIINSQKLDLMKKGDATFDFGKNIREFDYGIVLGVHRNINKRFGVYTNFSAALTPIFPSSFNGIEYKMYNMYLTVGLSYSL